jgi:tetratricopeptide (TPR) repeat protein
MKNLKIQHLIFSILILILGCSSTQKLAHQKAELQETETYYYGIEINDVLCGYSKAATSRIAKDGKNLIQLKQNSFMMISALGSKFNTELKLTYLIDPNTGQFFYHDSYIKQGQTELTSVIYIKNDTARFTTPDQKKDILTPLSSEVILDNTLFLPHLKKDFGDKKLEKKSYNTYEVREAEIQKTTYTKAGAEKVELAGKIYDAVILDELNHNTGLKIKWWIDSKQGLILKAVLPNNRLLFLTDQSVVKKIEAANLEKSITTKTNVSIADFHSISYMKVKATIEPTGLWITPESLNIPGQKFKGTVTENLIEGIFEIEHQKYRGKDAPPYPLDFSQVDSLNKYLEAEAYCESDDPVLINKALEITKGSKDSWEAAKRLSKWVAENISYAIPGGGTARKTYDVKAGECGAHSLLLAAFCRAVGIPARVIWGCMYIPNFGGAFGQHAWNEIYIGKAGWVPVDATANEIDFIDSGHIRIGVLNSPTISLNAKKMEVLDHRLGSGEKDVAEKVEPNKFSEYLAKYTNPQTGTVLTVFLENDNLTVDIPNKVKLPFNEPGESDKWFCKYSKNLFLKFNKDDSSKIIQMELHEIVPMQRQADSVKTDESVPDKFKPYIGTYLLAQLQAKFVVSYLDGSLAIYDPLAKQTVRLQLPDENGRWLDDFNKNTTFFKFDDNGNVTQMNIDSRARLRRGEPVAFIIEKVIEESGIEDGIKKYQELNENPIKDTYFSEKRMNDLGYKLLSSEKIAEAIIIFKLNTEKYPASWNVYDSLAEAYMKNGDAQLAIINYQKSIEMNPNNENGKEMLEKLKYEK